MSPFDHLTANLVDSVQEAERFLSWLGERRPHLAIDTETTGLDWHSGDPGFLRLVQFGDANGGWAVPVDMWRGVAHAALTALRSERTPTYFLNVKFDLHALEAGRLPTPHLPSVHDVGTQHRLLYPTRTHGLKQIATRTLGPAAGYGDEMLKAEFARTKTNWSTIPVDNPIYWGYGVIDTCLTAMLADTLPPPPAEAYEREMAVQVIMYGAECRGLRVDPEYTSTLLDEWQAEAAALRERLQEAGIPNPNSNQQVAAALKASGWEPDEFTETGQPRLDKEIIEVISKWFPDVASPLLRYKRLVKWSSSYLRSFLNHRDSNDHIHASINTQAARTGRMSVTNPAFQTLPRGPEIRDCIIPDDDHSLWCADYDGMEMRMFANFCQDPGLIQMFLDDEDPHTYCAALAYGVPQEKVTKDQRQSAKNTNFSRLYGAGPAKIAKTAGVPEEEIRAYINGFDTRFPSASGFLRSVQDTGNRRLAEEGEGYVMTTGGRRIPCDDDKVYALTNYVIQGSCADVFKDAVIRISAAGLGSNILMPVHDELVFQFHNDDTEGPREAARLMADHGFSVPMTVGLDGPLTRWGDKYR